MGLYKRENSPVWWASVSVPGHPRIRFSTGTTDRAQAQLIHDEERIKLWHKPTKAERQNYLSTYVLRWCSVDGRSESDIRSMAKFMKRYGDCRIALAAEDRHGIDRVLREFVKTPGTYTRYVARLRPIFQMAKDDRVITEVPKLLTWTAPAKGAPKYLEDKTALTELLRHLPEHQRPMVLFAVYTGMRQSNVLNLKWSNVDIKRKLVWVDASQTKAGKTLHIALSSSAVQVLEQQLGEHPEYVFTYRRRPIKEIKTAFIRACVAAGLGTLTYKSNPRNKSGRSQQYSGLRWHDLRHTFASWHAMNGTPLQVIQMLGGWSDMRMVENYTHLTASFVAGFADNIGGVGEEGGQ